MSAEKSTAIRLIISGDTSDRDKEGTLVTLPLDTTRRVNSSAPGEHSPKQLSTREREVLNWLASGRSAREVSLALAISVYTVRAHVRNILQKLGAVNIPHAVARAFQTGILPGNRSGVP